MAAAMTPAPAQTRGVVPPWLPWGLLALGGLLLRLGFLATWNVQPTSDFQRFFEVARGFAERGELAHLGRPYVYQPPGWPLLLGCLFAATGPSVVAAKALNVALSLGTLALGGVALHRLPAARWAKLAAFAVLAGFPSLGAFVNVLGGETLAAFCVGALLFAAGLPGRRGVALSAVALTALCLTRPQFLLVGALLPLGLLATRSWRPAAAGLFGAVLLVGLTPWTVRNWRAWGALVPVDAHSGYVLLVNNHPGNSFGGWMALSEVQLTAEQRARFEAVGAGALFEPGDEDEKTFLWTPAMDRVATRVALGMISERPGQFAVMGLKRFARTYVTGGTTSLMWALGEMPQRPWLPLTTDVLSVAMLLLSLAGAWRTVRLRSPAAVCACAVLATNVLATFLFEGQGRYALPAVPAACLLVALALSGFSERLARR